MTAQESFLLMINLMKTAQIKMINSIVGCTQNLRLFTISLLRNFKIRIISSIFECVSYLQEHQIRPLLEHSSEECRKVQESVSNQC